MKSLCLLSVSLLLLLAPGRAETPALPAEMVKTVERISRFEEIRKVADLPGPIAKLCGAQAGGMADPGRDWNVGCVIVDKALPGRRLIWAIRDGNCYVVHYEQGGIAHFCSVMVAKWAGGDSAPYFSWTGAGRPLADFAAFQSALKGKPADPRTGFGY